MNAFQTALEAVLPLFVLLALGVGLRRVGMVDKHTLDRMNLLGFRGPALVGLACVFMAPSATSSFNLASAMDSDADLAAQLVVFTSLFSLGTVFCWVFVLSGMGVL